MDGFGYQMKKGLAFHRGKSAADIRSDRRTLAAQDSGDEWALQQQSLGMSWLYRMISTIHISGDHAFSDDSRSWLARRVDSADTSAVQERRASVWWEHQQRTAAPAPLSLDAVKEDEEKEAAKEAAAAAAMVAAVAGPPKSPVASSSPHSGGHTGSVSLPQLTLQHILDTPVFLSDFRQHLEENFCAASINFLEAFQTWSEIDPKAYPRKFIKQARHIYEQYIDPSGEEIVSIPSDVRAKVEEITRSALSIKTKKKMDVEVFAPLRNVMEEAKKHVLAFIESSLYPRFLKSEDYQEMLAVRFEDDSESKGAAAVYKGQPWDNSNGYKSLQITLVNAKGVSTNRKAWSLLTVDSRSYKSDVASPAVPGEAGENDEGEEADGPECAITPQKLIEWNETFEFPIISTTQYLKMTLLTRGLIDNSIFMGRAFVNIAQIQEANGQPITVKLMPRTYQDKVSGEITITAKLRVEEAADLGHQVAQDEDNTFAVADAIRGLVSKKKKRFQDDGFDLDLSYITDRIIAMGFPAEGFEGVFRNNAEDVLRFFERRHPLSYKLYNLCSERSYDPAKFKGRVSRYPFDDHNPPTIDQIKDFCLDVHEWLETHPQHVVAIHCKAGKGRTGTVIACYLIYARMCPDAASALQFFAVKRTKNAKGVTIPSQIRYVHYFEHYCQLRRSGLPAPPKASLFLKEIILHNVPKSVQSGEVFFNLTQNNRKALQYKSKGHLVPKISFREVIETDKKGKQQKKNQCKISFSFGRKPILLTEDVNFEFHHTTTFGKEKMFQFWLNTRYTVSINAAQEVESKVKAHAEANPHERFAQWKEARGSAIIPSDEETPGNPDAETKEAEEEDDANEEVDPKALPADRLPYIGALSSTVDPTDWREENLRLTFDKWSVDKICKDTKNKNYPADFKVELVFLHSKHSSQVQQLTVAFAEPGPAAHEPAHDVVPGPVTPGGDASPPIKPVVPELKVHEEKLPVPDQSTSPRASPRGEKKDAQHKPQGPQTTFKIGKLLSVTLPKPAS